MSLTKKDIADALELPVEILTDIFSKSSRNAINEKALIAIEDALTEARAKSESLLKDSRTALANLQSELNKAENNHLTFINQLIDLKTSALNNDLDEVPDIASIIKSIT